MLLQWIQKRLSQRLIRKKQDVIHLRWQLAMMEQKLEKLKKEQ